jgi:hypothetical protein
MLICAAGQVNQRLSPQGNAHVKLHLIKTDNPYRPILMLSAYVPSDVDRLCEACRELAARRIERFALHDQPWVQSIQHCQFLWEYSEKDLGVKLPSPGSPFALRYSDEAWLEVEGKLLVVRIPRPNHLNELTMEGDVPVIISPEGKP